MSGVVVVAPAPVVQYDTQGQAAHVQIMRRIAEAELAALQEANVQSARVRHSERILTPGRMTSSRGNR